MMTLTGTNSLLYNCTLIMHQNGAVIVIAADIIGVVVLYLKVVDLDGAFQYLVLDLFDYNVLSIEQLQPVACAEIYRTDPALFRHIERVVRGRVDLGVTVTHMNDLIRLVDEHILDLFELRIAGLGHDRSHPVALSDLLNGLHTVGRKHRRPRRAYRLTIDRRGTKQH